MEAVSRAFEVPWGLKRPLTGETGEGPEGGLDLTQPWNREALRQMDWGAIGEAMRQGQERTTMGLFRLTVCNPASCPIGWVGCRGRNPWSCHYYDLLLTVLGKRRG